MTTPELPKTWTGCLAILCVLAATNLPCRATDELSQLTYPPAHKVDQIDDYHGVKVADPYRWLEEADSQETRQWVDAENKLTFKFLESIPQRESIRRRLAELWNSERFDAPIKKGGRYFYSRNSGLQNQSVLSVADSLNADPRVLLDPNALSKDGIVSLTGQSICQDGQYLAYGLSTAGSDWQEWKVKRVATGEDLPDHLKWIKWRAGAWTRDNRGFFYGRFPEPAKGAELTVTTFHHKLYYHRLGTPQSDDILVYARPEHKEWGYEPVVSSDGSYLVITVAEGDELNNRVLYQNLGNPEKPGIGPEAGPVIELHMTADAHWEFIDNMGPDFLFLTNQGASHSRIVAVDPRQPAPQNWRVIVPEAADALQSAALIGGRIVAQYLKDARSSVKVFSLDGHLVHEVPLPGLGTATGFSGEADAPETFYSFNSYTTPPTIYHYNVTTGENKLFRQPKLAFRSGDYESTQVFYNSKDGTRVPMIITHKKGLKHDGQNPTYLYGYGGFYIAITPRFSPAYLVWLEMGGVLAVPNLRGGSEYGHEWHDAGRKLKKQNVFDDFIAAAQWLMDNQYTSRSKLAIGGASNGGLLVGACLTQRPDLFGAALPDVGVMDMLRFTKFTEGWGWVTDYGSPDNREEFKALYAYSPLHNIKPGTKYPATLVTTSDHDDRVIPGHSFKFTAALQAAQAGDAPILIRIETQAGHGAGKPTAKRIEEASDRWAFLSRVLNMR